MKSSVSFLKKYGSWLFLGMIVLLTLYMDVYMARHILDSDTSDFLYHAKTIAEDRNPFTRDRFFTTELSLLDVSAFFSIFFFFTNDWTLVRILGTILMQLYYVLSFVFLCRQAKIGKSYTVFFSGILLLPFSTPYARLILYHLYYILYFANAMLILAFTVSILHSQRGRLFSWTALILLWLFVGANGIRHMLLVGLPLLAYTGIHCLQTLSRYQWQNGSSLQKQPFWQEKSFRLLGVMMVSILCFAVGYLLNQKILLPYYGAIDMSSVTYQTTASAERYVRMFHGWLIATGIRNSALSLVGIRGLALAAALFSFGYLLFTSLKAAWEYEITVSSMTAGLFAAAFLTTTFVFVFESSERIYEQYYILVCAWAIPALAVETHHVLRTHTNLCRKLLVLLTCLCFVFQGAYTMWYIRVDKQDMDKWECLYFDQFDAMDEARDCVSFMENSSYKHGMIDFWYANLMMEMSNGELTVAPLLINRSGEKLLKLQEWGTSRSAFARENLPEKIVVFFRGPNEEMFLQHYPDAPMVHDGWIFNGYEIDADEVLIRQPS